MYQSGYTSEEEPETTLILKDTEENIEDCDDIPIITSRKKETQINFETTFAGIKE